jgi:hypothetical protein
MTEANTIANEPPALIPSTLGEERGFLVTACMIAPAIPRLAPTRMATSVRGRRIVMII